MTESQGAERNQTFLRLFSLLSGYTCHKSGKYAVNGVGRHKHDCSRLHPMVMQGVHLFLRMIHQRRQCITRILHSNAAGVGIDDRSEIPKELDFAVAPCQRSAS